MPDFDKSSKHYISLANSGELFRVRAAVENASTYLHTAYDSNTASMLDPALEQLEDGPEVELDVLCTSIEDALGTSELPHSLAGPLSSALRTLRTGRTPRTVIPRKL